MAGAAVLAHGAAERRLALSAKGCVLEIKSRHDIIAMASGAAAAVGCGGSGC